MFRPRLPCDNQHTAARTDGARRLLLILARHNVPTQDCCKGFAIDRAPLDGALIHVVEAGEGLRQREVVVARLAKGDIHALITSAQQHLDVAESGAFPGAIIPFFGVRLVLALFGVKIRVGAADLWRGFRRRWLRREWKCDKKKEAQMG